MHDLVLPLLNANVLTFFFHANSLLLVLLSFFLCSLLLLCVLLHLFVVECSIFECLTTLLTSTGR